MTDPTSFVIPAPPPVVQAAPTEPESAPPAVNATTPGTWSSDTVGAVLGALETAVAHLATRITAKLEGSHIEQETMGAIGRVRDAMDVLLGRTPEPPAE